MEVIKEMLGKCFFSSLWTDQGNGKVVAGGKSWILGRYGGDGGCSLGCQQSHDSEDSDDDASYNGDDYGLSGASDDIFEMFESVLLLVFLPSPCQ